MRDESPLLGERVRVRGKTRAWGLTLFVAAALTFFYLFDPVRTLAFTPCPFHLLTGLYCPGCGTARGLHALLHGHLLAALRLNLLMVVALPLIGCGLVLKAARPSRALVSRRLCWSIILAIVAFGVLRNLPAWPFCLLRP